MLLSFLFTGYNSIFNQSLNSFNYNYFAFGFSSTILLISSYGYIILSKKRLNNFGYTLGLWLLTSATLFIISKHSLAEIYKFGFLFTSLSENQYNYFLSNSIIPALILPVIAAILSTALLFHSKKVVNRFFQKTPANENI